MLSVKTAAIEEQNPNWVKQVYLYSFSIIEASMLLVSGYTFQNKAIDLGLSTLDYKEFSAKTTRTYLFN